MSPAVRAPLAICARMVRSEIRRQTQTITIALARWVLLGGTPPRHYRYNRSRMSLQVIISPVNRRHSIVQKGSIGPHNDLAVVETRRAV
jgi:hypothetical protein